MTIYDLLSDLSGFAPQEILDVMEVETDLGISLETLRKRIRQENIPIDELTLGNCGIIVHDLTCSL